MNPPAFDLGTLLALVKSHSWLPIAIALTLYLRTLLSDKSRFPWTIPAPWLGVVSAFGGLVFGALVSRQAGASWGMVGLTSFSSAATGGFLDGLASAIWGDAGKAPKWARLLLVLAKDLGGGGAATPNTPAETPNAKNAQRGFIDLRPLVVLALIGIGAVASAAVYGVIALTGCNNGVPTPQTQADVNAGLALGACMFNVYTTDENKQPPPSPLQVAVDVATQCSAQEQQIVSFFGTTHPVSVAAQQLHAAGKL